MKRPARRALLVAILVVIVLVGGFLGKRYIANALDDRQSGLKEGVSHASAAVVSITAGFAVIDWLFRRLLLLPAADKAIQRLAEQDAPSNGG